MRIVCAKCGDLPEAGSGSIFSLDTDTNFENDNVCDNRNSGLKSH